MATLFICFNKNGFCLWGYVKNKVYKITISSISTTKDDAKERITTVKINNINKYQYILNIIVVIMVHIYFYRRMQLQLSFLTIKIQAFYKTLNSIVTLPNALFEFF